ncbi:hypothetical protein ACFL03_10395, partial [Thermodesulfobacteriota bacterium]
FRSMGVVYSLTTEGHIDVRRLKQNVILTTALTARSKLLTSEIQKRNPLDDADISMIRQRSFKLHEDIFLKSAGSPEAVILSTKIKYITVRFMFLHIILGPLL